MPRTTSPPALAEQNRIDRIRELAKTLNLSHIAATIGHASSSLDSDPKAPEVFVEQLLADELRVRTERRIERLIRESKLPERKLLADFDFDFQPSLDKSLVLRLATMDFVRHGQGLLLGGNSGTGKSYLAKALALCGCICGYRVRYTTAADMLKDLHSGLADDSLDQKLKAYLSPCLLVIDELGFDRLEQQTARNAALFFKVIDGRYRRTTSSVITTNIDFESLGNYLGDPVATTSIADRMLHHSVVINIQGPSWRLKESESLNQQSRQNPRAKSKSTSPGPSTEPSPRKTKQSARTRNRS